MAYNIETRKMVLEYLEKGHTHEEAIRELGVSKSSIMKWRKILRETGSLEDRQPRRTPYKLHSQELKSYIADHPKAYYAEIAKHFNCSDEGVRKACKRLGITRRKRAQLNI